MDGHLAHVVGSVHVGPRVTVPTRCMLLLLVLVLLGGCAGTGFSTTGTTPSVSSPGTVGVSTGTAAGDAGLGGSGAAVTTSLTVSQPPESSPQIGVNFIRFFWAQGREMGGREMGQRRGRADGAVQDFTLPEVVFADFAKLGIQAYRQFVMGDLLWDVVEPSDDEWQFERADAVLMNSSSEPIVTLFSLQYASPNPPWATADDVFQKTLGPEARDYLTTVVKRYAPYVRYWELGNEMDHWRAADPGGIAPPGSGAGAQSLPACLPTDGFTPQEQGAFLAEAAALIRELDPDAVIVMPGISGLDTYQLSTWLPAVVQGGGKEWFDIVSYHYYLSWFRFPGARLGLTETLKDLGVDKPVWLTETGSSSSFTLSQRTNYPNSAESQAADIFRRVLPAYAAGDDLVLWHTYIGSPDTPDNSWRCYGLRDESGRDSVAYASFQLLTSELLPVERVEVVTAEGLYGLNVYRVTTRAGAVRYVAWGMGTWRVPEGVTEAAGVVAGAKGSFTWRGVSAGDTLTLSDTPILLR